MSQLALVYESPVPNAAQTVKAFPIPEPSAGQIQVKIEATAVNPVDYKIFDYGVFITKFPNVLGSDAAGEVTKVGADVTKFKLGDRVIFQGSYGDSTKASFQQYATVDADFVAKIPNSVDFDSASTVSVASVAATAALYDVCMGLTAPWNNAEGHYKGQSLVVLGGSSSVGSYTIQFAALSGFKVITTCSPKHFDYVKSLGATTVIDRSSETIVADIIAAAGGKVTYVVDAVSLPETQAQALDVLTTDGKLALFLQKNEKTVEAEKTGIKVFVIYGLSYAYPEFFKGFWAALPGYLERGVLKPNRPHVIGGGLRGWEEAFTLHRSGKISGEKIVLRPQETTA